MLVRHGYVSGWHFPGGGVEVGETCEEALGRELEEEARIAVNGAPVLHGLFFNARPSRRDHVAVYVIRDFAVLGERAPDREIEEARFFPRSALPEGTTAEPARGSRRSSMCGPVADLVVSDIGRRGNRTAPHFHPKALVGSDQISEEPSKP